MADQRATPWNFDQLGDDFLPADGDNAGQATPADAYVAKNIDQLKQSWVGGPHVGESRECVALVKQAIPEIGRAANWRHGTKIDGYNDPPLEPGTALATFKDGKYQNDPTGNHSGIFLRYDRDNGRDGFWLLEQMRGQPPHERFIRFSALNQYPTSQAQNYSVVRRPLPR